MSSLSIAIESPRIIKHYSCSFNFVKCIYASNDVDIHSWRNKRFVGIYVSAVRWSHVIFIHYPFSSLFFSIIETEYAQCWRLTTTSSEREWKNSSLVEMYIKWYVHKFSMYFFLQLNIGITNKHITLSSGVRKHPAIVLSSFCFFCCRSQLVFVPTLGCLHI